MQALLKPLLELAEYEDIVKKKKEAPGVLHADRLCEFPEDSYDVRT